MQWENEKKVITFWDSTIETLNKLSNMEEFNKMERIMKKNNLSTYVTFVSDICVVQ